MARRGGMRRPELIFQHSGSADGFDVRRMQTDDRKSIRLLPSAPKSATSMVMAPCFSLGDRPAAFLMFRRLRPDLPFLRAGPPAPESPAGLLGAEDMTDACARDNRTTAPRLAGLRAHGSHRSPLMPTLR